MDERIKRLTTPELARTFAKNARERGHPELEIQALAHARTLQGIQAGYTTPAELAIASALYAYEEEQSRIKGRTFRANRTRQMLAKRGALGAAERMVLSPQPSVGYEVLQEAGLQDLSFEAIIVQFPGEFSEIAVQAAQARLDGRPPPIPPKPSADCDVDASAPVVLDSEAREFLAGFNDPSIWFQANWLPRYRTTTQAIARDLAEGRLDEPFDLLWKSIHNDISNAGRGVLKYDTVDAMRDEFLQVLREIHEDGSPANFEFIVERFETWKTEGRTDKVPHLLIARAFAGVHPQRYHTTVDASSQDRILDWFAQHTGHQVPRSTNWAVRAQALVKHLDRVDVFGRDIHARNIFPWFVLDQLRGRAATTNGPPGHSPRPASAFADLPAAQRLLELRHNLVQNALFAQLEEEFGAGTVWTEYPTGTGGFADAYVRHADQSCTLYEIKIADTATQVVRQAMGQLLEYSFRAGGLEPVQLFAVGEPALDEATRRFLERMRADFNLEIDYLQVELPDDTSALVN
ncbi:MAG: hypothetical protein EPN74_01045 [Rhodanobacter sp.]|nr:MAG: hypothetical protein EPN74_01045 [Rhodanobacter sp.]